LGKIDDARAILDRVVTAGNHVGLLSEHFIPRTNEQCGCQPSLERRALGGHSLILLGH
jgi:GH15 family glucan-1,4-alpha-glucosidase